MPDDDELPDDDEPDDLLPDLDELALLPELDELLLGFLTVPLLRVERLDELALLEPDLDRVEALELRVLRLLLVDAVLSLERLLTDFSRERRVV